MRAPKKVVRSQLPDEKLYVIQFWYRGECQDADQKRFASDELAIAHARKRLIKDRDSPEGREFTRASVSEAVASPVGTVHRGVKDIPTPRLRRQP